MQCLAAILRKLKTQDLNEADNEKVSSRPSSPSFLSLAVWLTLSRLTVLQVTGSWVRTWERGSVM